MEQNSKSLNPKAKRLRKRDYAVIIFLLFISGFFINLFRNDLLHTFYLKDLEPIGTVIVKKNIVQRRLQSRLVWDRLSRESPVYIGDLIRISEVSAATLYINDIVLDLEENTLIRIMLSEDGEIIIQLNTGTVSVYQTTEKDRLILEIDGKQIHSESGVVLTAGITESGSFLQTSDFEEWIEKTGRVFTVNEEDLVLISPAANSMFRYERELPLINFQWGEIDNAESYLLEVSGNPDFKNPQIKRTISASFSSEYLNEGVWYWRITPVFPSVFNQKSVYSKTAHFNVEQGSSTLPVTSISEWLASESPVFEAIASIAVDEPENAEETQSVRQEPPPLLASSRLIQPGKDEIIGYEQLSKDRSITFSWTEVQGANSYILTIFRQAAGGRRQIMRTGPVNRTNYVLNDLSILERGTITWQIEAVLTAGRNEIERRGRIAESTFIIDFPLPTVQIDAVGDFYVD